MDARNRCLDLSLVRLQWLLDMLRLGDRGRALFEVGLTHGGHGPRRSAIPEGVVDGVACPDLRRGGGICQQSPGSSSGWSSKRTSFRPRMCAREAKVTNMPSSTVRAIQPSQVNAVVARIRLQPEELTGGCACQISMHCRSSAI